jgi:hypothetical protein
MMIKPLLLKLRSALEELWNKPLLGWKTVEAEQPRACRVAHRAQPRTIVILAACLAILAAGASYTRASMFAPVLYEEYGYGSDESHGLKTFNLLFDADVPQYAVLMTQWWAPQHQVYSSRHPLLSLYVYPPTQILRALGLPPKQAIQVTMAMVCAIWTALMFSLLIVWGCRILDAIVFTLLANISASAMFWFSVPESHSFGSATILAALILTLWPRNLSVVARYTAAAAVSLSMTTMNAIVGLIAGARNLTTRDFWIAGTSAWFIVCMLWALQKWIFPSTEFFLGPRDVGSFFFALTPQRIAQVLQVMLSHNVVMPEIGVMTGAERIPFSRALRIMTVQKSVPGTGSIWGATATLAWCGLLGLGIWAAFSRRCRLSELCLLAGGFLLAFFLAWSAETFMFSITLLPFLVVLAAGVTFTRFRVLGLLLAVVVILLGGANNWAQFERAVAITDEVDAFARAYQKTQP